MVKPLARHRPLSVVAGGLALVFALPQTAGAIVTRTSGTGQYVNVSWTEYDSNEDLGLPGNVHVGFIWAETGPYGSYLFGNVTDFDCDEGETPWGGGHGVVDDVAKEGVDVVSDAIDDAIDKIIEGDGTTIDAGDVVDTIGTDLSEEIPDVIVESAGCDYIQDRFLEGNESTKLTVDLKTQAATITGTLTVTSGGHGEPSNVLGRPTINLTITGGSWAKYEYSSDYRSENFRYKNWQKGTSYDGGAVAGKVGGMGFDDDADDESYGGFSQYKYKTVDRVR